MNRWLAELDRLYGFGAGRVDGVERPTRVLVMEMTRSGGVQALLALWHGVQSELELPAPAIAVSGHDALQLWFSLAMPIAPADGMRFLHALRERFVPEVPKSQVRLWVDASELPAAPCVEVGPDRWSAFVTHDLASLFAETPWLDTPPNLEGQAAILGRLQPIGQAAFGAALDRLGAVEHASAVEPVAASRPASTATATREPPQSDPARFLTGVMNDESAPLALRIEAARVLLRHTKRG